MVNVNVLLNHDYAMRLLSERIMFIGTCSLHDTDSTGVQCVCRLLREDLCASLCSAARAFQDAGGLPGLQARDRRGRPGGGRFSARINAGREEVDMFVYRNAAIEGVRFHKKEGAYFQVRHADSSLLCISMGDP